MEIAIDFAMVRAILVDESRQAAADIAELGPVRAYERSQLRHEARIGSAADASTLACQSGCAWCCNFTVDLRPVEVFRVLDFMERELPAVEQARVRQEIATNSAALRHLDEFERMERNVKCPFLAAGRCTIYAARPETCRNYHATSVAGCRQSFEEPENRDIDPEFAPLVYQSGGAHVDAFSRSMRAAGYDVAAYEMNGALAAAMAAPAETRRRFEAGQTTFPDLQSTDVPPEFGDEGG
jgi:Fe-S-cluster containining protein